MSRKSREYSETKIYNVGQKGHNGADVFFDDEDRAKYLHLLRRACANYNVLVLAFTLMSNHVHLVLQGEVGDWELTFKSLGSSFGQWYNKKYDRSGTLWNGRYYSDPIKDNRHLLAALGYIYNNPVAAGIVKTPEDYEWTSFSELDNPASELVNNAALAEVIDLEVLREYTLDSAKDKASQHWNRELEVIPQKHLREKTAINLVKDFLGDILFGRLHEQSESWLQSLIAKLLEAGSNISQISRVTGLNRRRVSSIAMTVPGF